MFYYFLFYSLKADQQGSQLACLHVQSKSGFFGGPAFFQPIRALWKLFRLLWLAG